MKRWWWLVVGAAGVLSCAGMVLVQAKSKDDGVPTLQITRSDFRQRITAEGNLEAATSTPLTAPVTGGRRQKIAWIIADGSRVDEGETVVRFDPTQAERDRETGLADQQMIDHRLDKARLAQMATSRNLDRDADLAETEADNARQFQTRDNTVFSRNEILESSIDTELAEDRANYARRSKVVQVDLAGTDIELLEISRRKAEIKLDEAAQGLAELEVKAPHSGIVILERDWRGNVPQLGETAWPGKPLATIPDLGDMEAEVFVLEADAGGLAEGQTATLVVEARPDVKISAQVKSVDPVAQRRVGWVPVQYFRAVLTLDADEVTWLKPGQRVQAEILVAHLSDSIAVPRQAIHTVEGRHHVFRLEEGEFSEVEVELGVAALGKVVIESGLDEGDVIALRDPDRPPGSSGAGPEGTSDQPAKNGVGLS